MWNVIQAQDLFLLFVHKFEIRKEGWDLLLPPFKIC